MKRERGAKVVQTAAGTNGQSLRALSNEELSDIIAKCESAIAEGTAEIEDFEAFVLCQKELARRTWA
ncbi:MAG: hypothetical protein P8Y02_03980 [Deinococcales bacterium]|jgi:hypothetical protein